MDRFAELRRLRAEGKTKRDLYYNEEDSKIYDELGEAEYEKRQRERLREDDFVVDDDGKGYVDNGEYEWDQRGGAWSGSDDGGSEEAEDNNNHGGTAAGRRKRRQKPAAGSGAKESQNKDIMSLFRTQKRPRTSASAGAGASSSSTPAAATPKIDVDLLVSSLGPPSSKTPKSTRRQTPLGGSRSAFGGGIGSLGRLGARLSSSSPRGLPSDTPTKNRQSREHRRESHEQDPDSSMLGDEILHSMHEPSSEPPRGAEPDKADGGAGAGADADVLDGGDAALAALDDADAALDGDDGSEPPMFSMKPVALTAGNDDGSDSDDELLQFFASSKPNSEAQPELPASEPPVGPELVGPSAGTGTGIGTGIGSSSGSQDPDAAMADLEQEVLPTPSPNSEDAITGSFASTAWNLVSEESPNDPDAKQQQQQQQQQTTTPPETFRFYWMDYSEMQGGLILFGKSESGEGATVFVYGIDRDVYVLPKPDSTADAAATEVREFFFRNGVDRMRSKKVTLRDVFAEDKSEHEYVHVKAPYSLQTPLPNVGETYASVHGMQSSRIENFLIGKNIMGPCWLDVKISRAYNGTSYTKLAYECASPAHITVASGVTEVPKLTLMSVTVTTVPNAKLEHELVSISLRIYRNVDQGEHDATKLPSLLITGIRAPPAAAAAAAGGTAGSVAVFPVGFKQAINEHNKSRGAKRQVVETFGNEHKLLSWFFSVLKQQDPDAFVGHNLTNIHLATILERALALQLPNWSLLGRYNTSRKPTSVKSMDVQRICSGRMLVDLRNAFGEEIASGKCTDYSLEEMCNVFLKQPRLPFDTNLASGNWLSQGSDGLIEIIRRSEYDTLFVTSIALKNQMLPLSRQLTNLAGNPWRATLAGTRSGRNDYLLMHEFAKNGFLIPDKQIKNGAKAPTTTYTGGHVFEPVAGLHQSCVLVMDFNSLYPSIIQEYNICLTTVDFDRDQTEPPELPASTVAQGLLPKILQNLVERRREVKNLMKSDSASAAQQTEWNIRQTALKLTANSMYGCLGFADSRFCAKPLAQLITLKGREALLRTRDLAVEKGLEVLYGDTDSVMINTNALRYADAYAIGVDFKRAVNKQYRLMEIDIDHVFRKLLLYLKKKYAAVIMHPDGSLKLEYKGLDMRRREFSDVCKISSTKVLQILFGLDEETQKQEKKAVEDNGEGSAAAMEATQDIADPYEIFSKVYQFCHDYAVRVRDGKVPPKMFVMRNQLGKELSSYPNLDRPQLVVAAARVKAGYNVRAKDVINYIITKSSGSENLPFAQRAVAPEELGKQGLTPDYEWYLQNQIFLPINRFCEKIEGFDSVQLAEAMELKSTKELKQLMRNIEGQKSNLYDNFALVTLQQDSQRFAQCDKLELIYEGNKFVYEGVDQLKPEGVVEPQSGKPMPFIEIAQQVDDALRKYIGLYYQNWLICDSCGKSTRLPAAYSSSLCPQKECTGQLRAQYSSQKLYTQMCYLESLFDITRAQNKVGIVAQGQNGDGLRIVESIIQKYIQRSGYSYVNIGQYFH